MAQQRNDPNLWRFSIGKLRSSEQRLFRQSGKPALLDPDSRLALAIAELAGRIVAHPD